MTKEAELEAMLRKYGGPAKVREHPKFITNTLYGNFKVGKTVTAARIPDTLIFACDKNWTSVLDYPELADVEVQVCQGLNHFEAFCTALIHDYPIYRGFKHIQIDPFNVLIDLKLDWLTDNYNAPKNDRDVWKVRKEAEDPTLQDFAISGLGDYRVIRDYFRKFIIPICNIPKHVTFVCHVREPGFLDKVKLIRPALPGQTWQMLARYSSLISYMKDVGGKKIISFETDKMHDGGACFRNLHGKVIDATDIPALYAKYSTEGTFNV
jgi:AAA domain-containing protein